MSLSPRLLKLPTPLICQSNPDRTQEGGIGDLVVVDVVDLQSAGCGVAHDQVARAALA